MNNKQYQHLFFDLDHTLWDFDKNAELALAQIFKELNVAAFGISNFEVFRAAYSIENKRMWERFRNGYITQKDLRIKRFTNTLAQLKIYNFGLAQKMSDAYLELLPLQVELLPYAKEILDYCKEKKYHLHIITNGFEEVQYKKLNNSGLSDYFEEIITSELSLSQKPQKEIFDFALKASGANISDSIMIGDNWDADIIGAMNAGWEQVYYNPHRLQQEQKASYEIQSLEELKDIF